MIDSRIKRWALAALVAPLALAAPAAAQWTSNKPPVLTPEDYPPVADEPDQPAQQAQAPEQQSDGNGATQAPRALNEPTEAPTVLPAVGPVVQVGSLGTAEGPPVGTLDSSNGGLGDNLWGGSERGAAEQLLSRAPLASADPVLRTLTERVVLTRAAAPTGAAPHAFVTVRLRKLLDAGLLDDAGTIAAQAAIPNDPDFARVQADALLFDNRASDVCGNATAARLTAGDPFWLKLRAYCAAAGGDQPTADLTLSVMRAQGNDDPTFDTLMDDALNHKTAAPGSIADPTALDVFLLQQAGLAIPDDVVSKLGVPAAVVAVHDPANSARSQFAAAEIAIRSGAFQMAQLKVLADAQDIPLNRVANAANDAPNLPFFTGQMLLRRAAVIENRPRARMALAYQALAIAQKDRLLPLAADFQSDILASLRPMPTDPGTARLIARGLLLAHRPQLAARWVPQDDVMRAVADLALNDPTTAARLQADYVVYANALTKNPPDPTPDPDRAYKALVLGLSEVLGQPMSPTARMQASSIEAMHWDGKRPDSGVMRAFESAASDAERKGEALLMLVDTVNDIGLRHMAPDVTIEFVRQLGNMGLPHTARALALDALAQYEPPPLPPPPPPVAQ